MHNRWETFAGEQKEGQIKLSLTVWRGQSFPVRFLYFKSGPQFSVIPAAPRILHLKYNIREMICTALVWWNQFSPKRSIAISIVHCLHCSVVNVSTLLQTNEDLEKYTVPQYQWVRFSSPFSHTSKIQILWGCDFSLFNYEKWQYEEN